MNTKHTEGPWRGIHTSQGHDIIGSNGQPIAELIGINQENNAVLIAAAPELLEALETVRHYLEGLNTLGVGYQLATINSALARTGNGGEA